jgi:hypothetical protein
MEWEFTELVRHFNRDYLTPNHLLLSVVKKIPLLIGGIIACFGTAVLIQFEVGLNKALPDDHHAELGRDMEDYVPASETCLVRTYVPQGFLE